MQLPSMSALGSVQLGTMLGKLNGVMDATTPTGCRSIRHSTPRLTAMTSPATICGSEQANSVSSIDFSTSAVASDATLPFSSATSADSSPRFCSINVRYR
jgi:hypothetical protein